MSILRRMLALGLAALVSLSTTASMASAQSLPAFPYLPWPDAVPADDRTIEPEVADDTVTLIDGRQLRRVGGRVERRVFSIPRGSSTLSMRRLYRERIAKLAGVPWTRLTPVNRLQPVNSVAVVSPTVRALFTADADPVKQLGLARYDEGQYRYEVYVVRTSDVNAWFVVQTSAYSVHVTTVREAVAPR